jgi:hypothetical protein
MADRRIVKATLADGTVLLEGENLDTARILELLAERFPGDTEEFRRQKVSTVIEFADGRRIRAFRFSYDSPRIVGDTIYL